MDAKTFLEKKGLIYPEYPNWKYQIGADGKHYKIEDLLEEYALLKAHEIMIMKNK